MDPGDNMLQQVRWNGSCSASQMTSSMQCHGDGDAHAQSVAAAAAAEALALRRDHMSTDTATLSTRRQSRLSIIASAISKRKYV